MRETCVNIDGEWINTEDPRIEFLDIQEGVMGQDIMVFLFEEIEYERDVCLR
jgi:hypothetical protein